MSGRVAFMVLAILALGGGVVGVGSPNLFRAALGLMVSLLGVAGLFLIQRAEFLAVVQILIYVGGIAVLIVFAVTLLESRGEPLLAGVSQRAPLAAVLAAAIGGGLLWIVGRSSIPDSSPASVAVRDIGTAFLNRFLVPFEAVSLLLLVALIGALLLVRED